MARPPIALAPLLSGCRLQACAGALEHNWGWTDNGWCGLGGNVFFPTTGLIRFEYRYGKTHVDRSNCALSSHILFNSAGNGIDDLTQLAANLPVLTPSPQVKILIISLRLAAGINIHATQRLVDVLAVPKLQLTDMPLRPSD